MNIAQTILNQIDTLDRWAMSAWGAKDLVDTGDGVKFKTSGMTPWKGWVHITYKACPDLYEIEFYKFRKFEKKTHKKVSEIYAFQLTEIIDSVVG
jgi:hypothetical protein